MDEEGLGAIVDETIGVRAGEHGVACFDGKFLGALLAVAQCAPDTNFALCAFSGIADDAHGNVKPGVGDNIFRGWSDALNDDVAVQNLNDSYRSKALADEG